VTWYYMPSTSAADTAASSLPCDTPESTPEPWLTLSGTATQRPLSWHGWRNRAWIKLLSGLTCSPSTLQCGADEWISSLPVSRVSHSAPPASGWVLTTTDTSGRGSQTSSATFDPDTSCWKTSGELFEQCYPMSSLTLPDSGSMRNGACSQRPPLVHPIAANAGGAWPTPQAGNANQSGIDHNKVARGIGESLVDVALRMWPTPRASMNENRTTGNAPSHGNGHGYTLAGMALTSGHHDPTIETAGTSGRVLNPRFVEALMGLPTGWLISCTSAATDLSPSAPRKQSASLPTGQE
jgi:hypothetical protein